MATVFHYANNKHKEILKCQENRSIFVLQCWGNCLNQEGSICHTEVFPRAEWQITWGPLSCVVLRRTLSQAGDGLSDLVVSPSPQGMMTQPNTLQSVSTPLVCRIFRSQTESPCTVLFFFTRGEVDLKHCRQILWSKRFFFKLHASND